MAHLGVPGLNDSTFATIFSVEWNRFSKKPGFAIQGGPLLSL